MESIDLTRRRHSDSPRILQKLIGVGLKDNNTPSLFLREKSSKILESDTSSPLQVPFGGLYDEYLQMADMKSHKAVERHSVKREDDLVSTHTTFFPKKLTEEELKYAKSCMPTSCRKSYYETAGFFPRGVLSLVYIQKPYKASDNERHLGTDYDADELTSLFLNLGFIIQRYDNYSIKELKMVLDKDTREDYTHFGCFAFAMLSFGVGNEVFGIDGSISLSEISELLNNTNIDKIPKIIILNVCNGKDYLDPPEDMKAKEDIEETESSPETLILPISLDSVCIYSNLPGFYSWKNNTRGSWFLQAIFSVFSSSAHSVEITSLLTAINKRVVRKIERASKKDGSKEGEGPLCVSRLREDFFLCPPYGPLQLMKIALKWVNVERK